MIQVAVATGSRAEYGLLHHTIARLVEEPEVRLSLLVTGTHLSASYGSTVAEIERDGFEIADRIELPLDSNSKTGVADATAASMAGFARVFAEREPDLLLVLGDRFEILGAVTAALFARIPVAHLHGGELTSGAFDDAIRHSITKMSHLHFVAAEEYRRRVIQMGEPPGTVHNVGAPGVESIRKTQLFSRADLESELGFGLAERNLLLTFHPPTLSPGAAAPQVRELLGALEAPNLGDFGLVFTAPNADSEGDSVRLEIEAFVERHKHRASFALSLGHKRYLSLLRHVDAVVGNSSSGLIEAPALQTPTVNIGDRQAGRLRADSVLDCDPVRSDIAAAITRAVSDDFQALCRTVNHPYGDGNVSEKVVRTLIAAGRHIILGKQFYDLPLPPGVVSS